MRSLVLHRTAETQEALWQYIIYKILFIACPAEKLVHFTDCKFWGGIRKPEFDKQMTQCKQACMDDKKCAFVSFVKWASPPTQCYHYPEYPTKQEYCSYGKSFKKYRGEGCEDRKYFSQCKQQHTLLAFPGGGGVTVRGLFRNVMKILVYCLIVIFYHRHIYFMWSFSVKFNKRWL